jgi:hypothetical protein
MWVESCIIQQDVHIYKYTVDSRQKAGCQELDAGTRTSAALRYKDNGT